MYYSRTEEQPLTSFRWDWLRTVNPSDSPRILSLLGGNEHLGDRGRVLEHDVVRDSKLAALMVLCTRFVQAASIIN